MSNNYNNHSVGSPRGPSNPQGSNGFESLTGSLIYPEAQTPIQQSYSQTWLGGQSWPNYIQNSNNYEMHYQRPPTDNEENFSSHPEYITYDDGEDFYDSGDPDKVRGIGQDNQLSNQNGGMSIFKGSESSMLQKPASVGFKTDEQPRSHSVRPEAATQKLDTAALNDRAAELRAKLLATKRGSTPGTPSKQPKKPTGYGSTGYNGSDDSPNPVKKTLTEKFDLDSQTAHGVSGRRSLNPTNKTDKTDEAHRSSVTQLDGGQDIEALFAEARAANAARAVGTESKQGSADKTHDNRKLNLSNTQMTTKPLLQSEVAANKWSVNDNMVSSDTSEPGEIRDDGPKPEPSKPKDSGHTSRASDTKPIIQKPADITSKAQAAGKFNTNSSGAPKNKAGGSSTQPRDIPTSHQSPGPQSISQNRNSHQSSRAEHRQERIEQPQSTQDSRHERARDPTWQPVQRAKDSLATGQQSPHAHTHGSERVSAAHQRQYEFEFQSSKENIERNAQAAAVYTKELEDKARKQNALRARVGNVDNTTSADVRGVRERRASISKATTPVEKPLAGDHRRHNQNLDSKPPNKEPQRGTVVDTSKHSVESADDLNDWLELTNYNDVQLRNQRLALFREMKATDAHRAELQRQAEQLGIIRTPSILSQESSEAAAPRSIASPKNLRSLSNIAMPPPPTPIQEYHDDLGIKIKNSANRENSSSPRRSKRAHADDDLGSKNSQHKLPRLDSSGLPSQSRAQLSPAIPRRGQTSLQDRISADDRHFPTEFRERSRSPQARRRSLTPVVRRRERFTSPTRFEIAEAKSEQEFHENISSLREYDAQSQDNRRNRHIDYNPRWNSYRPNLHNDQNAPDSNYRGRGRGGRGGYPTNTRGSYKPYIYRGGNHGGEVFGSASLNLQTGGQSHC